MKRPLLVVAAALGVAATVFTSAAVAGPPTTTCIGTIGAVSVGVDVIVPGGATCVLDGTRVSRDVIVQPGGGLWVHGATIGRDLKSNGAAWIAVGGGATVVRDVAIVGTTGVPTPIGFDTNFVCTATIGRDLGARGNLAPLGIGDFSICVNPIKVTRDVNVQNNSAQVLVSNNSIGRDLNCFGDNPPASGVAGSNTVGRSKNGECAGL